MRALRVGTVGLTLALAIASAPAAHAQAWSALTPLADLTAQPVSAELELPGLLTRPVARVGLFWTAGLPAGLPRDIATRRAAFAAGSQSASGTYRRPLEPSTRTERGLDGEAWGLLGPRGGAYGRIGFTTIDLGDGAFGDMVYPYRSEPYVVGDTLGEPLFAMNVEIEGAGGWRAGRLLVGLGLGLAQRETRTVESAVPVFDRWSAPGAVASVAWNFGRALQLGAVGRWQREAELVNVLSLRAPSRLYRFAGYEEPIPINLSSNLWVRRFERSARAGGGAAAGEIAGVAWAAFAQREVRSSENYDITGLGERRDRWDAKGWRAGGAVQRRGPGLLFSLAASYVTLNGDAVLADAPDTVITADDTRGSLAVDVRLAPLWGWEVAATVGVVRETRRRYDELVGVTSDVRAWRPSGAIEVARRLGPFSASIGVARAEHNPSGSVPLFEQMGPIYRNWIGPAVGFDATVASARTAGATLRWQARPATAFWLGASHVHAAPPKRLPAGVPARPVGDRSGWRFGVGTILN